MVQRGGGVIAEGILHELRLITEAEQTVLLNT